MLLSETQNSAYTSLLRKRPVLVLQVPCSGVVQYQLLDPETGEPIHCPSIQVNWDYARELVREGRRHEATLYLRDVAQWLEQLPKSNYVRRLLYDIEEVCERIDHEDWP